MSATLTINKTVVRSGTFNPLDSMSHDEIRDSLEITSVDSHFSGDVDIAYYLGISLDNAQIMDELDLETDDFEIVECHEARYGDIEVTVQISTETVIDLTDYEIEVLSRIANPEANSTLAKIVDALT